MPKGKQPGRKCPVCGITVMNGEEGFTNHLLWEEKEDERIKLGLKDQVAGKYDNRTGGW